jgi:hypothetical protein
MAQGFMYLVVIMDWYGLCTSGAVIKYARCGFLCGSARTSAKEREIYHGSQFTVKAFTGLLKMYGIKISNTLATFLNSTVAFPIILRKFDLADFTLFD